MSKAVHRGESAEADPAGDTRTPQAADDVATVARGGLANLLGALVSAIANFVLVLVIARYVSAEIAGIFFGATSLFLILETLLRLGSDVGVVYFVARWRALDQEARIRPALRSAFVPVAAACVTVATIMLAVAPQLADLIGDERRTSVGLLRLLAVVLPIAAVYDVALAATRGFGRMSPTVVIEKISRPVLQVVCIVAVLAMGWKAGIGAAWAVPYVVAALAGGFALRAALRTLAPASPSAVEIRATAHEFWSFTLPRAVAGVAQIVLQRLDIVLVASLRGATDAAVYTAATRFLVLGQFVSQAIAAPVQPRLSASLAAGDTHRARELYRASTAWIVLISWPMFGTVAVFAPLYIGLFGHRYHAGVSVVVILALSMLVASAVGVVDSVVVMAGRTSWNLMTTLGALTVNVVVDVVLIPPLGIVGAAIGWCAAILAANAVPLLLAWRGLGLHPYGRATGLACALSAGCFGLLPGAGHLVSTVVAGAGLILGVAIYAACLWRWRDVFNLTALGALRRGRRPAASAAAREGGTS